MFTYEQNFHPLHLSIHTISLFKMLNIKSRSSCPMEDRIEIIQVLLHLYSHWVIVRLFKSFRIPVGLQSTIGLGGCSLWTILYHLEGFPGGSVVQNPSANAGDAGFKLSIGKVPWRRKQLPTPAFLSEKFTQAEEPGRLQSLGSQRVSHDWACTHVPLRNSLSRQMHVAESVLGAKYITEDEMVRQHHQLSVHEF